MQRNLLLKLAYDGTRYHGWQIQENAVTVQQVFQEALCKVTGRQEDLKACSRTDTGVHAREFCVSLKTESPIPEERLVAALNHYLPQDMAVRSCQRVGEDFHARYSCKGKEYCYEIWNHPVREPFLAGRALHYWYPIDEALLDQAARHYLGSHDFSSFCTLDKRERGDLTRRVFTSRVERRGDLVVFTVGADGFLYNMVRIMVGTLLRVQQGKFSPEDIPGILEAKDRKAAGPTAPACGLYLNRVFY
ncbi:MAG TPA: tRNA pseudouridine(38-40) synthase TruA [Candidatus Acutalibacter pullistercoris]|uniref:tRNA pseudouridine synthase A n=1 Tax=Candidatus Acutalibacter pullistercoris TaxID=2838418 RepID=A0A9D1YEZ7_9FIRM|nr:tRNA pseudouridine(38-40) synthase TruA [Candidatus Acutalibacter pullistercoris]